MLDRQKIEAILTCRFPGASHAVVAAATNAIMGLDEERRDTEDAETLKVSPLRLLREAKSR